MKISDSPFDKPRSQITTPFKAAIRSLALLLALVTLAGCAHQPTKLTNEALAWRNARQLVLVTTSDWNADHGHLRMYERDAGTWRQRGSAAPVVIGRAGSGWGNGLNVMHHAGPAKREGDGRSPAGVFRIGSAFGYAASADTALPYAAMTASHYCIDVPNSPLYNRIVDARDVGQAAVAGSTEPMRRDLHADGDQRYRLGFVIEHNLEATPGAGSCIFAHLWKSPTTTTAGCTAMAPDVMDHLLAWLTPERRPIFVLLPEDAYARLHDHWGLPVVERP